MTPEPTTEREKPESPDQFIAGLEPNLLRCRELGHLWEDGQIARLRGSIQRAVRCSSCGTVRTDKITEWGRTYARSYEYVDGYQMRSTNGFHVERADFRREVLKRAGVRVRKRKDWHTPVPEPE